MNMVGRFLVVAVGAIAVLGIGRADATPLQRPSIVGGQPADISQAPWQALLTINGREVCGGSYVSASWILTAAHCLDEGVSPQAVQVFTGVSRLAERSPGNLVPVAQIVVHPGWNPATNSNDVALIRLARPVSTSSTVQPVRLPEGQDPNAWPAAGTSARLYGWGAQSESGAASEVLRVGNMQVLAGPGNGACGSYGGAFNASTMICAGGPGSSVDACQGDSGGGLMVDVAGRPTLAGITSTGNGCGVPDFPGVYARVTTYLPWITGTAGATGMPPAAPTGVSVTALGKGRVKVSWTAPSLDGNSAITGFTATSGSKRCTAAASATNCVITGLRKGSKASVSVTAANALGQGAASQGSTRVR